MYNVDESVMYIVAGETGVRSVDVGSRLSTWCSVVSGK